MTRSVECFSLHLKGETGPESFLKDPFEQSLTAQSAQMWIWGEGDWWIGDFLGITECLRNGILMDTATLCPGLP